MDVIRVLKYFFLVFVILLPMQIISWDIYSNEIRDNINYYSFYIALYDVTSFSSGYSDYNHYVGASEPLYFFYMYLNSMLGLPFNISTAILNVFLPFSLACFTAKYRLSGVKLILFSLFFGVNYYCFVLFSELHRLMLAFSFVFLSFSVTHPVLRIFLYLLGFLSHFQIIFLLPLYLSFRFDRSLFLIIFSIVICAFLFYEPIGKKLQYYLHLSISREYYKDIILSMIIVFILSLSYRVLAKPLTLNHYLYICFFLVGVFMLGASRLNIIIYLLFYLFIFRDVRITNNVKFVILFMLVLLGMSYDINRIQYQYSMLLRDMI